MMIYFLLFLFGLCIGSFINCLVYRIYHSSKSIINGRSFCDHCKKPLNWYDNIPILSFVFLGGKSRCCHFPIPWEYPMVELATGLLTVLSIKYLVLSGQSLLLTTYYLLLIYALIVIFLYDLKHEIIPDQIVYPAIMMTFLFHLRGAPQAQHHLGGALVSGFSAAGFFYFLYFITKGRGMGFGDVKLALLLGLFLGFPKILIALYLAFLTGAIMGVILIILGKKKLSSHIPFGPFLIGGTVISLFFGGTIWQKIITGLP